MQITNEHFYDLVSSSDEEPISRLAIKPTKDQKPVKNKPHNLIFPQKKEEIPNRSKPFKNNDYFPQSLRVQDRRCNQTR